jgi:hypothetical protein
MGIMSWVQLLKKMVLVKQQEEEEEKPLPLLFLGSPFNLQPGNYRSLQSLHAKQ